MVFTLIEYIILGFIIISTVGTTLGVYLNKIYKKRWNFTYNLLEDAEGSGRLIPTKKGRARLVRIDIGGVEVFYLPKEKKYKVAYGKRSGNNHLIWAVDNVGYWHNVYFTGLMKHFNEVGIRVPSAQARMSESAIRKIVKDNYEQKDFMTKYGVIIAFGMLFLCIVALGVSQYYGLAQQNKIAATNADTLKTVKETTSAQKDVIDATKDLLIQFDIIKSGGTGLVPG